MSLEIYYNNTIVEVQDSGEIIVVDSPKTEVIEVYGNVVNNLATGTPTHIAMFNSDGFVSDSPITYDDKDTYTFDSSSGIVTIKAQDGSTFGKGLLIKAGDSGFSYPGADIYLLPGSGGAGQGTIYMNYDPSTSTAVGNFVVGSPDLFMVDTVNQYTQVNKLLVGSGTEDLSGNGTVYVKDEYGTQYGYGLVAVGKKYGTYSFIGISGQTADGYASIQVGKSVNSFNSKLSIHRWGALNQPITLFRVYANEHLFKLGPNGTFKIENENTGNYFLQWSAGSLRGNLKIGGSSLYDSSTSTGKDVFLELYSGSSNNKSVLRFGYWDGSNDKIIWEVGNKSWNNFSISTYGSGKGLIISDTGIVSVGTQVTTPSKGVLTQYLEVVGSSNPAIFLHNTAGAEWVFYANSSGRLSIWEASLGFDAFSIQQNGRVGINQWSPSATLHVRESNYGYTNDSFILGRPNTSKSALRLLANYGDEVFIQAGKSSTDTNAKLVFSRYSSTTLSIKEVDFLADNTYFSGTVGIGTSTPSEKLHVSGGNVKIETESPTLSLVDTSGSTFSIQNTANSFKIVDETDGKTVMNYDSNNKLHFTSDIYISKHDPRIYLIGDSSSYYPGIVFEALGATKFSAILGTGNYGLSYYSWADHRFYTNYDDNLSMVLTSSGDLGIGTSLPGGKLHVSGSPVAVVIGDSSSGYPALRFLGSNTDNRAYIQAGTSSSDTDAQLVISRYNTPSYPILSFTVFANTSYFGATGKTYIQDYFINLNRYSDSSVSSELKFMNGYSISRPANTGALRIYTGERIEFWKDTTLISQINGNTGDFENLIPGAGIVLTSPNGTMYKITVDDSGNLLVNPA